MSGTIARLWAEEKLPAWDGLYYWDDLAREVRLDSREPGHLTIGNEFDVSARLAADPEWLATVLGMIQTPMPDGSGSVLCGECGHGSEGYLARLNRMGDLVWAIYLSDSNPFLESRIDGPRAVFTTNLGMSISIDLTRPEFDYPSPPAASG